MANIDWQSIMSGVTQQRKRYAGANVHFFNAYDLNREKTLQAGREVYNEIPSISIQFPGHDVTVRRIEPQDIQEYPDKYAAFMAGNDPVESGTPLVNWTLMSGAANKELQYLGFKTVEQLAEASDEAKRKMGTLVKYVKMAKEWLEAATGTQAQIVALQQQLDREKTRSNKLEQQLEILMQRVEASEGTDLRSARKQREVIQESVLDDVIDEVLEEVDTGAKRGRPRKV
jgi:hypothetical protein